MSGEGKLSNYFPRSSTLDCHWLFSHRLDVPANFHFSLFFTQESAPVKSRVTWDNNTTRVAEILKDKTPRWHPWCSISIPSESLPFKRDRQTLEQALMLFFFGMDLSPCTSNSIFLALLSSSERVPADFNIVIFVRLLHASPQLFFLSFYYPFSFSKIFIFILSNVGTRKIVE